MDDKRFAVTHTDEEWRRLLTREQYQVLRGHGTEAPGRTVVGSLVNSTPLALSSATTASMPVTVSPK